MVVSVLCPPLPPLIMRPVCGFLTFLFGLSSIENHLGSCLLGRWWLGQGGGAGAPRWGGGGKPPEPSQLLREQRYQCKLVFSQSNLWLTNTSLWHGTWSEIETLSTLLYGWHMNQNYRFPRDITSPSPLMIIIDYITEEKNPHSQQSDFINTLQHRVRGKPR